MRTLIASPAFVLGLACLALHLAFNGGYGVFRDELYFIVCGLHPAFGYVDQPPLTPLIAGASYRLFGTALIPLRLVPALAMSATVALTSLFAQRLGGRLFAQILAGLGTLFAPVLLVDGLLLTTDVLQPLTWLGCVWCLVELIERRDERWWLAFGAIVGVSWQSKYLIAFFVVALGIGVIATPLRRSLAKPWLYAGAALALVIAAPNLIWQAAHGWPFLTLGAAGASGKNLAMSPLAFLGQQALFLGPVSAPVWIAGLWRYGAGKPRPEYRAIAIAWVALVAIFVLAHGKAYYLTPLAPALFAAGGVQIEGWLSRPALTWVKATAIRIVSVGGLVTLPMALPILSPPHLIAYQTAIGLGPSVSAMEAGRQAALPQYFADMFGWREMAEAVSRVYRTLPDDERAKAVFFGRNYGEAAALDIYGPEFGGPPAISGHNAFWDWGTRGSDGSVVILVGHREAPIAKNYADVETKGEIESPYAMPFETGLEILLLRSPKTPLSELWPKLRHIE